MAGQASRSTCKRSRSQTLSGDAGWKSEQEPDNMPHTPPHFLPKRRPGVQPPLSEYVDNPSPSELFRMYFDTAAVKTLCANTNKNVAKNLAAGKQFKWTELTEAELYQFIGLTMYMGILKMPNLSDYWHVNSILHVPYPQKVMSRDRYLAIKWNIHMSDPVEDALMTAEKAQRITTLCTGYAPCMTVYVLPAKLCTTPSKPCL